MKEALDIQVRTVKKSEVYHFICEYLKNADEETVIPITRGRALAWSLNPSGSADDPVLWLAYMGDKCVGYGGVLPGSLKIGNRMEAIQFGSTIYVDKKYRRFGVAAKIINAFLEQEVHLIITDPDYRTIANFYDREPSATRLGTYESYSIHLDTLNPIMILLHLFKIQPGPRVRFLTLFAKRLQQIITVPWFYVIHWILASKTQEMSIRRLPDFREEMWITSHRNDIHFERDPKVLEWMTKYPWMLSHLKEEGVEKNYLFWGHKREFLKYYVYAFYKKGVPLPIGNAIFAHYSTAYKGWSKIRLLDFSFKNKEDEKGLLNICFQVMQETSSDYIRLPGDLVPWWLKKGPLTKKAECSYYYLIRNKAKSLLSELKNVRFSDCDGEQAFTCP